MSAWEWLVREIIKFLTHIPLTRTEYSFPNFPYYTQRDPPRPDLTTSQADEPTMTTKWPAGNNNNIKYVASIKSGEKEQ